MKGMADGGIVGYDGGGTVNALGQEIDPKTGYPVPLYRRVLNALDESPGYQKYREMVDNPYGSTGRSGPHPRNKPIAAEVPVAVKPPAPATGAGGGQENRGNASAPPEKLPAPPKERTGIDQLRADKIPSAPPSMARPTVAATDEDYGAAYDKLLKAQPDPRADMPKEVGEIQDLNTAQRTRAMALADKQDEGLKALMAERNARLAGREGRVKEQEELNPSMSLITAGLAMMQSTGKGLAGIGEGAAKGMAQYMEGVKFNSAQRQKLEDARDALSDLQFNQETMTNKERLAAENAYTQGSIVAKNAVINTIQQREGVNRQTAAHLFDAHARQGLEGQRQQFEMGLQGQREASQERLAKAQMDNALKAAGISASAPLATKLAFLEKIGAAPEDSALYKGYLLTEQADKEPRMYEAYTKQLADPYGGADFLKRNPTFEAYKAGMSSKGSGGTMPNPNWKNYNVR
jgi:hypothetical protein